MFTTRPELVGTFGMVASTHWLASAAGMAVLESGGNAFDAAATAGFVLHVVEPHLNGPGGEVPALILTAGDTHPTVLCGQGTAPAAATIDHYQQHGLDLIPGTGLLAATVPGAVGAWLTLLRDHGTKSLREVLGYAIGYAEAGHVPVPRVLETITAVEALFRDEWPTSARQWLPQPAPGELLRNQPLARTYHRLVDEAEAAGTSREKQLDAAIRAWYEGFVAEAIDEFCRQPVLDDSGDRHTGLLTGADCAAWRPSYEPPIHLTTRGWTVYKVGPWCQGAALLQQLAMLEDDLPKAGSAELVHRVVEAAKLAFADREAWYGDVPDVPIAELLSATYAKERANLIDERASLELRPGSPGGRAPRLPRYLTDNAPPPTPLVRMGGLGEPTISRHGTTSGDTCHIDVADRWGNMISATPSGGWLQSSPTIPALGFCLGTRAQMFWLEQGLPSSLAPGKRPRSTLSPSFARRNGVAMAFGTPGGDQQDQWQLNFFLNHAAFGMDLQAAIDAPAWHTTAFPASFYPRQSNPGEIVIESRVDGAEELERRGHRVVPSDPWSLGRLSAVSRDGESGIMRAAANPRGMQGYAVGR